MIFKLHYWFITSGACALGILLGVFIKTYTDASTLEIGVLFMIMPFTQLFSRPIICSMADRSQAHKRYLMSCLLVVALGYSPFVIIPFLGPEVYDVHSRFCWYFLVVVKIIGDIGFGGASSIGDTLAINYAKRVGTDFSIYRMWGTISWMVFGLIIGQINEIWFLPKYTPAFMILIASSLLNMGIIWLWPDEYFKIVSIQSEREEQEPSGKDGIKSGTGKCLMPWKLVWAHMRYKISSLFCSSSGTINISNDLKLEEVGPNEGESNKPAKSTVVVVKRKQISKMSQLKILATLFRRDLRIVLYLVFFILCGMALARLSFFFISLSEKCEREGSCQFSSMAGYLQVAMASIESIQLVYVGQIKKKIGRVNVCTLLATAAAIKNLFYGTLWIGANPYYSLLVEPLQGIMFGFTITTTVEMGHLFSNEVQYLIPDLLERGIITEDDDIESVKLSVAATMQAIISSCLDGLGRGLGALAYGIIVEHYSYEQLWLGIGIVASIVAVITVAINIFDSIFKLHLGLDEQAKLANSKLEQYESHTLKKPAINNKH